MLFLSLYHRMQSRKAVSPSVLLIAFIGRKSAVNVVRTCHNHHSTHASSTTCLKGQGANEVRFHKCSEDPYQNPPPYEELFRSGRTMTISNSTVRKQLFCLIFLAASHVGMAQTNLPKTLSQDSVFLIFLVNIVGVVVMLHYEFLYRLPHQ